MTMMTGIVEQVSSKEVNTKWGVKPTYSIKVNGTWVSTGFKSSGVNVGDEVEFDGETGTYGVQTKTVRITTRGSGAVPSSSVPSSTKSSSSSGYGGRVFPIPPLHGDRSIVRQNALARSVEILVAAHGGKPFTVDPDTVALAITLARGFEAYTAGDSDLAEAVAESKGESK